jgi:hypothetical protein|tara:strand:+ start:1398 stop:1742 length:345 start_codon:yes stop_codon:yes gene_type:complete
MWGVSKWGSSRWGVENVPTSSGTSWNSNWAKEYGPDVDKAKKAPKKEVQKAIKALTSKKVDAYFEEAVDIAKSKSLAAELMKNEPELITVMTAYYAHQRMMQDEIDIAAIMRLL